MKNIIVALDAGHGLKTAGKRCLKSIDKKETREFVLNERIASRVAELVKVYPFIKVVRTNDITGEVDTPLQSRCTIANGAKADLFISIHHNAGANGKASGGVTVYTYEGSKHTFQVDLYQKLIQHTQLKGNRSQGCLQDGFHVLRYTNMPAVLIENGFMDSTTDTPIILTEEHAERTAQAIVSFLVEYANKED
jgi:N-acetylmuramoyl-L-alanine amidase